MPNAEFRMQKSDCGTSGVPSRNAWRRLALPAFCILHSALVLSLVGCSAKAKAQTLPDGPPLAVPSAPAHAVVIEQVALEEPPPELPPAPEPAPQTPTVTRPPARTSPPRAETPAPQPAVAPQPPPETPAVRAAPAAASAAEEKTVRALMKKASDDLERVDYAE